MNLAKIIFFLVLCCGCLNQAIQAQTTAFTYQGKLTDGGVAANGLYDFQFTIYGSSVGGTPVSGDISVGDVQVTNGIFTVNLDFGASPFNSPTDNHLEIAVRPGASVGVYTTLSPRQRITSSPYSIRTLSAVSADSLSAACVSCVTDANIDSVGANKVNGVLSYFQGGTGFGGTFLPAGVFLRSNGAGWEANGIQTSDIPTNLGSYIQNTTTAQTANFNVNGTGRANIFNANTQYNIGGDRVLAASGFFGNLFAGTFAGQVNTSGDANSFFGSESGSANSAGRANTFVGFIAGRVNSLGNNNTFLGSAAGDTNTTGSSNTIVGSLADVASNNLNFATAIGASAVVSSSNTVVLGRNLDTVQIPGALNVTGATTFSGSLGANILNATTQYNIGGNRVLSSTGTNLIVGIDAGTLNTGFNNSFFGRQAGQNNTTASRNSFFGTFAGRLNNGDFNSFFGAGAGQLNQTGQRNSFFGFGAGGLTDSNANSFFGDSAGTANTSGFSNSFFGVNAGGTNTIGNNNTIIGTGADVGANNLTNATAIGAGAVVSQSNSLVLGNAANVGIGTTAPNAKLQVTGGNVYISNPGNLIMSSPNGACWAISVSNAGVLTTASVVCP